MNQLVHIKDVLNNTEYIYNIQIVNSDQPFSKCIEHLQLNHNEKLKYFISETKCEIFLEQEVLKSGWVWNSTNINKNTLYILTLIPILHNISTQNIETNTLPIESITKSTSTQETCFQNASIFYPKTEITWFEEDFSSFNPLNPFRPIGLTEWLNNKKKEDAKDKNCLNTPFLDALTNELKEKLSIPNFGLKSNN
jgi:hypothetical protein